MAQTGSFNVGAFNAKLNTVAVDVKAKAADALFEAAEYVLGESVQLVPLETGDLMHSGKTDVDRENLVASVYYDTPYAVRQHEEMGYHHDNGRQAKYLEEPLMGSTDEIKKIIANHVGEAFS